MNVVRLPPDSLFSPSSSSLSSSEERAMHSGSSDSLTFLFLPKIRTLRKLPLSLSLEALPALPPLELLSSTTLQSGGIGLLHRIHLLKSGLVVPHDLQMALLPGISLGSYPGADPVAVAFLSLEPGVASWMVPDPPLCTTMVWGTDFWGSWRVAPSAVVTVVPPVTGVRTLITFPGCITDLGTSSEGAEFELKSKSMHHFKWVSGKVLQECQLPCLFLTPDY